MKNRPRPHIPLRVKVQVAHRQCIENNRPYVTDPAPLKSQLYWSLQFLFGITADPQHLDHDPPLRVRKYNHRIKTVAARYTPNANDPNHLIWRTKHAHHIKTQVRGDGAQFSDRVLIKRERRRERKLAKKPIYKRKIPQRSNPWPPRGSRPMRGHPRSSP